MPHQPPHPPPDQPWIPPAPGPMDIVPPSEDSNSQDSGEFAPDNRHIFNQNNHNFGGPPPDNFAMGPVNQFDYQVKHICCLHVVNVQSPIHGDIPLALVFFLQQFCSSLACLLRYSRLMFCKPSA